MKSIQILFKQKGVLVEKWIVGGSSKVVNKTKEFANTDKLNCEEHDDIMNTELVESEIFCKTCGVKLKLVPEWVVNT